MKECPGCGWPVLGAGYKQGKKIVCFDCNVSHEVQAELNLTKAQDKKRKIICQQRQQENRQ